MRSKVNTQGRANFIDITDRVRKAVVESRVEQGMVLVFVPGSTAAITTIEYEQGVIEDMRNVLEKIAPEDADYLHHQKWGDRNGAAHIKAALIGPDLSVPVEGDELF